VAATTPNLKNAGLCRQLPRKANDIAAYVSPGLGSAVPALALRVIDARRQFEPEDDIGRASLPPATRSSVPNPRHRSAQSSSGRCSVRPQVLPLPANASCPRPGRMDHSMTSSAHARIEGGIDRPSAMAALRLTTNSKVVGCWTGRSAGLAPLRISANSWHSWFKGLHSPLEDRGIAFAVRHGRNSPRKTPYRLCPYQHLRADP
jgi:hypothetical protein